VILITCIEEPHLHHDLETAKIMTNTEDYTPIDLTEFRVDPTRGFLPANDPLECLPDAFADIDEAGRQVPNLIMNQRLRNTVRNLRIPDVALLETEAEKERAMMLLAALASAYVWAEDVPAGVVPANLAIPFCKLADMVGRPPIVSHASVVLCNWRRIDKTRPVELGNIVSQQLFLGGIDEEWFYLATVGVEAAGAAILPALADAQSAVAHQDAGILESALTNIHAVLPKIQQAFERLFEHCDPYIFFHRIRPFLEGWKAPGLIYEGVSDKPQQFVGGSAAQSSLLQSIDVGLGIEHGSDVTRGFLLTMRDYMPPPHRSFIEAMERGPSVRDFVLQLRRARPTLVEQYDACVASVQQFRKSHIAIVRQYIVAQTPAGENASGTGGTKFMTFLSRSLKETRTTKD